jgi:hypothetical protein
MSPETEDHLVRPLFNDPPIPRDDLIKIMQLARRIDVEDVEFANSIVSDAGRYLSRAFIDALIRSDITDEDASLEIKRQKEFFARLSLFLPDLMRYFKFNPKSDAVNALLCLDDCHYDFAIGLNAQRQDRNRREILAAFEEAIRSADKALAALKAVRSSVDFEFKRLHEIYSKEIRNLEGQNYDYYRLIGDLEICCSCLKIASHRAKTEDDYLFVPHNQKRRDVVEYAYTMSRYWSGPPLVTTTGSDFSTMCSLLYEIVSGTPDESLAGAINRYARSKDRKEADAHDLDYGPDYDERLESDNFYAARQAIESAIADFDKYRSILGAEDLNDRDALLIKLMMKEQSKRAEAAMAEYGPHLIWADQRGSTDFEEFRKNVADRVETVPSER